MEKIKKMNLRQSAYYAIVLGALACFCHFAYQISGQSVIVGLLCPVNESVWEHMKFMFFPFLLWWIYIYITYKKCCEISLKKVIISAAVTGALSILLTLMLTYTYKGIIGRHFVIVDIFIVFLVFFIVLRFINHVYGSINPKKVYVYISLVLIIIISAGFFVFTFNPPKLEIFKDSLTGLYGI